MVVTDPPAPPACTGETEGELREKLAAYFLSAPPLDRQDDEQKRRHKAALRRLLRLENRSILQAAGLPRPLSQGDLAVLLRALLDALRDRRHERKAPDALCKMRQRCRLTLSSKPLSQPSADSPAPLSVACGDISPRRGESTPVREAKKVRGKPACLP